MIWTGICHDDRTQLKIVQGTLNAVKYRSDIIDPIVLPFLQQQKFDHVFNMKMQDVTSRGSCKCVTQLSVSGGF
jgi:hypothetical protein